MHIEERGVGFRSTQGESTGYFTHLDVLEATSENSAGSLDADISSIYSGLDSNRNDNITRGKFQFHFDL